MNEGDRAALLAAIDEAAGNIGKAKGGPNSVARQKQATELMNKSNVNATVARDLVSNAGNSRIGDMNDFAGGSRLSRPTDAERFEHGKTLLNNDKNAQMEEDLRSLRSEYDYGSKKKFVDVLGNVSQAAKLNRMRAQHEMEQAGALGGADGVTSYKSHISKKSINSKYSRISRTSNAKGNKTMPVPRGADPTPIPEEDVFDEELEAKPEDFVSCNVCLKALTEDEKIINARFVNEAMAASRDISIFPICISCNFE